MAEALIQISAPIERIAPDAIRLERVLDAPVETVWRYLTEANLRQRWFMGGTDATAGGEFELLNDHDNLSDDDVPYPESYAPYKGKTWNERVLRFEPPRLLKTTFQGGNNGVVTFELTPEGERTRLVLTHSGIQSGTGARDVARLLGQCGANVAVLDGPARVLVDGDTWHGNPGWQSF